MTMNHYKIDWNRYGFGEYPYALHVRAAWWRRWQHVQSFKTVAEAKEYHAKLTGLPIVLR
jgi:hypothetical protein